MGHVAWNKADVCIVVIICVSSRLFYAMNVFRMYSVSLNFAGGCPSVSKKFIFLVTIREEMSEKMALG